jgi:hypothetical protein
MGAHRSASEIASRITGAIRDAARATGASFDYLLRTAQRESNLDPAAKASTSSATGLFQFTDQTWLHTLKVAGPELGYGRYADAIATNSSGQYTVSDPALRREVMQLRYNPAAASAMAGAFTQRNAALLTEKIGRQPTQGELYIAHFLGAGGAVQLINAKSNSPALRATGLFPAASAANPTIFHDVRGKPRSVQQVYDLLVAGHGAAKTGPAPIRRRISWPQSTAVCSPMPRSRAGRCTLRRASPARLQPRRRSSTASSTPASAAPCRISSANFGARRAWSFRSAERSLPLLRRRVPKRQLPGP